MSLDDQLHVLDYEGADHSLRSLVERNREDVRALARPDALEDELQPLAPVGVDEAAVGAAAQLVLQ